MMPEHFRKWFHLEPDHDVQASDQLFLLDVYSSKWGNRFYEMRFFNSFSLFSDRQIRATKGDQEMDAILSLPLYAMIQGSSVSEL